MADPIPTSAIAQKSQVGIETTYGTQVAATVLLQSIKIKDQRKIATTTMKASGAKLTSVVVPGLENGDLSFEGQATYEEIGLFLNSLALAAATDIPSMTIERGPGIIYPGCVIQSLDLKCTPKDGVQISGKMFSRSFLSDDLTAGLSPVAQTPITNAHVTVKIDGASIDKHDDATQGWFEWTLSLADLWIAAEYGGSKVIEGANEGDIKATFTLKLEATSDNLAYVDSSLGEHTVEIVMTNGTDTVTIKFNVEMEEPQPHEAQGAVYAFAIKFTLKNTEVATTTNLIDVTLPV